MGDMRPLEEGERSLRLQTDTSCVCRDPQAASDQLARWGPGPTSTTLQSHEHAHLLLSRSWGSGRHFPHGAPNGRRFHSVFAAVGFSQTRRETWTFDPRTMAALRLWAKDSVWSRQAPRGRAEHAVGAVLGQLGRPSPSTKRPKRTPRSTHGVSPPGCRGLTASPVV